MCISPAGDNGSFAIYIPCSGRCDVDAGGPTAKDKSSRGTGSCQGFCVLDHVAKEAMALHRLRPGPFGFAIIGSDEPKVRLRMGGRWTRRSHREAARPDFCGGAPRHSDLCLWYALLWSHAAEDSLPCTGCQYGAAHVDDFCTEPLATGCGALPGAYNCRRALFDGAGIPVEGGFHWYGSTCSLTALCARTLCPFSAAFRGLTIPEEPLGGYIPRAFATILSTRCMLLGRPMGRVSTLQRPPGRSSPSTSVYPVVLLSGH